MDQKQTDRHTEAKKPEESSAIEMNDLAFYCLYEETEPPYRQPYRALCKHI